MKEQLASLDWTPILSTLGSLVVAGLGWLLTIIRKKAEAEGQKTKAETALLKLGELGLALAGKAWTRIGPKLQAALADGKLTAEERAAIEAEVEALAKELVGEETLAQLGEALGLPLAGVVAKLAAFLIERYAFAHDATTPAVSRLAYPVDGAERVFEGG